MLNRQPGDRTLPTLVTLLVIGILLMTFDVRSEGEGVTSVMRRGTQTIVAPLQKVTAFVVNPVVDMIDSMANVASLRETNLELSRQLAAAEAALVAVNDDMAMLELLERLYNLDETGVALGRTEAQIIGRVDAALIIDKGTSDGVAVGQPVIDTSGYVVGSVVQVTSGSATILPITAGPDGIAVTVGDQLGWLLPQINTKEMVLDLIDARDPVLAGDRVVTSSASVRFPAGYPVGEVTTDAAPSNDGALSTGVMPYSDPDTLRVVVVLAWPPDPIVAVTDGEDIEETTTTTTKPPDGSSTTSIPDGDG